MPYSFYGGVHPPASKTLTLDRPSKRPHIPKKVILPLLQHTGSPAEPLVNTGDIVKVGQVIAKPSGLISSAVHASISGKVIKIDHHHTPLPAHPRVLSITIESQDDEDQDLKLTPVKDVKSLSKEAMLDMIRDAGIVGLGGAAFPTHVKLSPPKNKPIDTVILNGAECEPYLTCDHRIMLEKSNELFKALDIVIKILDAKEAFVAIEDNKLSAIYAMEQVLSKLRDSGRGKNINVVSLKTKYPQGAEKQIIKSVLNRVVPAGGLPMDVGCIVLNAGTLYAIYEAVYLTKPLIERVVTITGSCVREPMNLWVRIGTRLESLTHLFGGFVKEPAKVIIGGPMMGVSQYAMDTPIVKGTSGVLFLSKNEVDRSEEGVCIRCGKCIEVCPMGLVPTTLMYRVKKENFEEAGDLGIAHCYECGACAYACPAKIPLLDYMKYGKSKVIVQV